MTETLLKLNENNIPRRSVVIQKSTPPLLTERGEETARRKHAAYGSAMETELALQRNICGQAVCARASYAIEVAACQTRFKKLVVKGAEHSTPQSASIKHSNTEGRCKIDGES